MIVARVETLVLTHLPSVCCFSDPFSRCTRKRLPLMSTHRLLVTWYLWSPYVAINELRAVSIIITKPSPPFPVCDIVLIPVLLPIFLHGCEIKSGSGLGTRLMSDMRFISEILFTASKKRQKWLILWHVWGQYLDKVFTQLWYELLLAVLVLKWPTKKCSQKWSMFLVV